MNKTKIIATVGPATASKEMIRHLILNGVDTFRINMSHSDDDFCRNIVRIVNELNAELNTYVAIMIDIKGPIVRIGKIQHNIRLSFSRLIPAPSCTGKGTVRNAF